MNLCRKIDNIHDQNRRNIERTGDRIRTYNAFRTQDEGFEDPSQVKRFNGDIYRYKKNQERDRYWFISTSPMVETIMKNV